MDIHIQPIGFNIRTELIEFIQTKTQKLIPRCKGLVKIQVTLKIIGTRELERKKCEIRLVIPGNDLISINTATNFEEAVLSSIEILERRLEERKNRRIDYSLLIL
jgi:putative sigma-54 modulation protein